MLSPALPACILMLLEWPVRGIWFPGNSFHGLNQSPFFFRKLLPRHPPPPLITILTRGLGCSWQANSICGCEKVQPRTGLDTPALPPPSPWSSTGPLGNDLLFLGAERKPGPGRFLEPEFFVRQKSMSLCDSRPAMSWAGLCEKCGLCALTRGVAERRGFPQGNPYGGRLVPGQPQAGESRPPPPGPGRPAAAAPAPRGPGSARSAQKSSEQ